MDTTIKDMDLKSKLISTFHENRELFYKNTPAEISALKDIAIKDFERLGFPHTKLEDWRFTNLANALSHDYSLSIKPEYQEIDIESIFLCEVPDMDTYNVVLLNGWFASKNASLSILSNGTIIGSLAKAMQTYPHLVKEHYGKYANTSKYGLDALNTAFSQDGIFIYVPDNVKVNKPVQIINVTNSEEKLFVQPRNLFIVGKNSELTIVNCDHSLNHNVKFINSLTEVFIGENATLNHYKMQNIDNNSALINSIYFHQSANSNLTTNSITLNGGLMRNNLNIALAGEHSNADLFGIYLIDSNQLVDNCTFVDHIVPNCTSNELYKGIMDDKSRGVFNGGVLVRKDAQKTQAFQSNRNILLSDDATINSKPHLEIYADDVKCSHGATVGQLDPEAMFYMRSRGISEDSARMLLMYAFANEVINKINIEVLRERIDEMVSKRLRGELSICDQCVLQCKDKAPSVFNIDMTKI
ncbi:MAG: Fe-S cluster assembly protein SufD [Bacteroidetes bacterium]|nr:Fe-S cluster assembly protein SufD [Bacteroidota bacterium]